MLDYLQLLSDEGKREELQVAIGRCSAKDLRGFCLGLGARVRSKDYAAYHTKAGYAELVTQLLTAKSVAKGLVDSSVLRPIVVNSSGSTRRTKNCNLRLSNVIFSDAIEPFLDEMNSEPTQAQQMDSGAIGGENSFWKRVQLEFISNKPEYETVVFSEESFDGYDLSTPVQHSSKKLRDMWEELCTAFTSVSARFSSSETPELGFLSFCLNRFDVYYLHCWLHVKPNLLAATAASSNVRPSPGATSRSASDNEGAGSELSGQPTRYRKRKSGAMGRLVRAVEAVAKPVAPTKDDERAHLMQRIKDSCETLALVRSIELGSDLEAIVRFELERYAKRLKSMQDEEKEEDKSGNNFDLAQATQSAQ
ncbi:hypothetical protein PHYBOEH_009205 [Phytophthora boehmeriae]|uniref:Uncharacterized protein n=1 Tax=Phytophthora boehmeriae TaxID=109152 RepID=A0A8T1X5X2_9STRA|nr:hypothetical protein PHYBOEH_009205 [Phytophthora boehmeriae]